MNGRGGGSEPGKLLFALARAEPLAAVTPGAGTALAAEPGLQEEYIAGCTGCSVWRVGEVRPVSSAARARSRLRSALSAMT